MVGAPPTSPTWFAEVGPAPRWVDPGEAWLARQLPARGNRSRKGRSEGSAASPGPCSDICASASLRRVSERAHAGRLPSSLARCARLARQSRRPGALGRNPGARLRLRSFERGRAARRRTNPRWLRCEERQRRASTPPRPPYPCSVLLRTLLAGLAGVALSLSAPPVGFFWVLPVAVAAYVVITAGMTPRRAWVPGLAFGVGYCYVLMWWMREVDVYAWVALSGLEALFYGLLGAAVPLLRRLPVWPLWVAVAWTAMEVLRSGWPFSGMPWGRLAFAVVDTPVGAGARVRRGDRRQPAARAGGGVARCPRPGRHPPAGGRSRAWSRPLRSCWLPHYSPGSPRPTAPSGSPRCRATCRATAPTCWPTSAR